MDCGPAKDHCGDCFEHTRIEEMMKEMKNSESVIWEDLKKNVSFKVFSTVLSIIVVLMSTVISAQFYQINDVHQDLLRAINDNHQTLSDRVTVMEGNLSSLAISQATLAGEIKSIRVLLNRIDKTSENHKGRILHLEKESK